MIEELAIEHLSNVCVHNGKNSEYLLTCKYQFVHLPTMKSGGGEYQCNSKIEFLLQLNKWNSQQPGTWLYYYK